MLKRVLSYKVELAILIGFLLLFSLLLAVYPAIRVGDGSNYYAMFLAWKTNLKPYMTPESWQAYQNLEQSGQIKGLADTKYLQDIRQPLTLGETTDFSHFWLYSLLAYIVGLPFSLLGFSLSVHASYLLLHALLLSVAWILAYRNFSWKGLAAVALLTLLSPIVWFSDKVHTEFFTFSVTTSAVILFLRKRYLPAAFFFSLAATQNISFAAISGLALLIGLYDKRAEKYSFGEMFLITATLALNVINPLYSFFRHGAFSPQQVHGYIQLGSHWQHAYIWFFDPDIGLFPHWPIGLILLISFVLWGSPYFRNWKKYLPMLLLVVVYIAVSLAAQTSTVNINAGGNPGVSRYAMWYLALFFPPILLWIRKVSSVRWFGWLSLVIVALGAWFNLSHYHPGIDQFNYIRPSALSYWVQKHLPALYNPPVEIFSERYGNRGENILNKGYLAVLGPDCRKLLLIDRDGRIVLGGQDCNFDRSRLFEIVRNKVKTYNAASLPAYANLSQAEFYASRNTALMDTWYSLHPGAQAVEWLLSGWSFPESWGIWMAQETAEMRILCPPSPAQESANQVIQLELKPLVAQDRPTMDVHIFLDQNHGWTGKIPALKRVYVPYTDSACDQDGYFDLHFVVSELISPLELGFTNDERPLGIGLVRFRFLELHRNEP